MRLAKTHVPRFTQLPQLRLVTLLLATLLSAAATAQTSRVDSLTFANPEVRGVQSAAADHSERCCHPRLSDDGRYALFITGASNLVANDHNGEDDLFMRDRQTGTTRRINLRSDGRQGRTGGNANVAGSISADGHLVAFSSSQIDLIDGDTNANVDVFLHNTLTGETTLAVAGTGGAIANAGASAPSISASGRFIVFVSFSNNLPPGPNAGITHVYLLDRDTGTIERISNRPDGQPSSGGGEAPTVSDDGRFVAFLASGDDLVAGVGNAFLAQVYVRDRQTAVTRRLSEVAGVPASNLVLRAQIAGNGSAVVFETDASNLVIGDTNLAQDIFLVNVSGGAISRLSVDTLGAQGTGVSRYPSMSRNGRRIAFSSQAMLTGSDPEGETVYLRDLDAGSIVLASLSSSGVNAANVETDAQISGNGQVIAFHAFGNLVVPNDTNAVQDRFVRDLLAASTTRVNVADATGPFPSPAFGTGGEAGVSSLATRGQRQLSADARYAVVNTTSLFLGSTQITVPSNNVVRIDRNNGSVNWINRRRDGGSPLTNGSASDAAISGNGRFIVYRSNSTVLVPGDTNNAFDVFWFDVDSAAMERANLGPGNAQALVGQAFFPTVSDDGNAIAFSSTQTNLVAADSNAANDVFVRLRDISTTRRVSIDSFGSQANGASDFPVLSAQGQHVSFTSLATNLAAADTNGLQDVFRHNLQSGATELVSVSSSGAVANGNSFVSAISADGNVIAFSSAANNLVAGDSNGVSDIFVRDLLTGTTTRVSVSSAGVQATGSSFDPSVSADGRFVAFMSNAANLVSGDNNLQADLFRHDRVSGQTIRMSVDPEGRQSRAQSFSTITTGTLSPDGLRAAFASNVSYFVLGSGSAANSVSGGAILLSAPAIAPLPDLIFRSGFESIAP